MFNVLFWLKSLMWLGVAMFFAGYYLQLSAIDHTNTRLGIVLVVIGLSGMVIGFALLLWMKYLVNLRKQNSRLIEAAKPLDRLLKQYKLPRGHGFGTTAFSVIHSGFSRHTFIIKNAWSGEYDTYLLSTLQSGRIVWYEGRSESKLAASLETVNTIYCLLATYVNYPDETLMEPASR